MRRGVTQKISHGVRYAANISPLGGQCPPRLPASGFPIRCTGVSPNTGFTPCACICHPFGVLWRHINGIQIRGKHGNSDTSANEMRTHQGVFLQTSPYKRGANIGATGVLPAYRDDVLHRLRDRITLRGALRRGSTSSLQGGDISVISNTVITNIGVGTYLGASEYTRKCGMDQK